MLHHFSEDPSIELFVPHVPRTNPHHDAAVWAIDGDYAPLYWFPRECPRVTVWPRDDTERESFESRFVTAARRIHAIECGWLARMRSTLVYRYDFADEPFTSWPDAAGQWIAHVAVAPIAVEPLGDLLDLHAGAGIELRIVPSLWPLHDVVTSGQWEFSNVRMRNAVPR